MQTIKITNSIYLENIFNKIKHIKYLRTYCHDKQSNIISNFSYRNNKSIYLDVDLLHVFQTVEKQVFEQLPIISRFITYYQKYDFMQSYDRRGLIGPAKMLSLPIFPIHFVHNDEVCYADSHHPIEHYSHEMFYVPPVNRENYIITWVIPFYRENIWKHELIAK